MSKAELDRETGIEHAVLLLGTAPLSPDVRRALYRWLAEQPGAQVRHDARDELGRPGTGVTFETVRKEPIPPYTVTAAEILDSNAGVHGIAKLDRDRIYTVSDNFERRRWRVDFIVDVQSGELLQQVYFFSQGRVGKRPFLTVYRDGPKIDVRDPGGGSGAGGANVFITREHTRQIEPTAAVCQTDPNVCR